MVHVVDRYTNYIVVFPVQIKVKVDLPQVGQNLVDHVYIVLDGIKVSSSGDQYFSKVKDSNFKDMLNKYEETGEGILGDLKVGPQADLVSKRAKQTGELNWPDFKLTLFPRCTSFIPSLAKENFKEGEKTDNQLCLIVTLTRPKSTGNITINSTEYKTGNMDDTKLAIVDFNMFGNSSDVDVLVEGKCFKILKLQLGLT